MSEQTNMATLIKNNLTIPEGTLKTSMALSLWFENVVGKNNKNVPLAP